MSFIRLFGAQARWALLAELWAMLAALVFADSSTGWDLSLFVFYALPIFAAAWYVDRTSALVLAIAGAAGWWWSNLNDHPYASNLAYLWAAVSRSVYFLFVAVGGSALAAQNEALRVRLEALEHAAELEQELVRISESEQRRIGQDLHDGHCQTLAAIRFAVDSLSEDLQEKCLSEAESAKAIGGMLKDAISEVRGIARGVFPVQVNESGLLVALDELAATTRRLRHTEVAVKSHGEIRITDPEVGMHLYRIAQEALHNASTHAQASRITLALRQNEDELCLTVRDDGAGFSEKKPAKRGMGLTTMKYRASIIGATLDIGSDHAGGTIVSCVVPAKSLNPTEPANALRT